MVEVEGGRRDRGDGGKWFQRVHNLRMCGFFTDQGLPTKDVNGVFSSARVLPATRWVLLEDGVSNLHRLVHACSGPPWQRGQGGNILIDFGNQLDIGVRKWKDQVPTSPFFYHLPPSPSWSKPMMKQLEASCPIHSTLSIYPTPPTALISQLCPW